MMVRTLEDLMSGLNYYRPALRRLAFLVLASILSGPVASAQDRGSFYNGMRSGGQGGQYDRNSRSGGRAYNDRQYNNQQGNNNRGYNDRGNNQRYDDHRGGIGPGKGALIGGAGGAALGALLGGGLKGALVGGAAGAGIGAIAGQAHQNSQRRNDSYPR
jgi:hypothetical protein